MNQYDLTVHDINVKDATIFGAMGKVTQVKRVTIMIGDHGPFTKDFPIDAATTTAIKSWIDDQVAMLSDLTKYGNT